MSPAPAVKNSAPRSASGRPPGRSAFQAEMRRQTRATIMAAARQVFSTTPYLHATIDDMLRAASVSRATFYMHFASKLALAQAVHEEVAQAWLEIFQALLRFDPCEAAALRRWFERLVRFYVENGFNRALMTQLQLFEPEFRQTVRRDLDHLVEHLGTAGLPGFARAVAAGPEAAAARAESYLLLNQLDLVCRDCALAEAGREGEVALCVADTLRRLTDFVTL